MTEDRAPYEAKPLPGWPTPDRCPCGHAWTEHDRGGCYAQVAERGSDTVFCACPVERRPQ